MKKETKAYIKNVVKNEFIFIDLINVVLGIAILVLAALSLFDSGSMLRFAIMFTLGTVLMALNGYKCLRKRSVLGVIYGIFMLVTAVAAVITFRIQR